MGSWARTLAVAFALLVSRPVSADCPLPKGADPSLAAVPTELRLTYLRDHLLAESERTSVWSYVWLGANAVLIAGTASALSFYPKDGRVDIYVGLVATTVAALPLVLAPPDIEHDGTEFVRLSLKQGDPCALLARGEHFFERDAKEQSWSEQWIPHAINAAYNVAVGLVLGLFFKRWPSGGSAMLSGFTIGEFVLFTQPRTLPDEWRSYLSGQMQGPPERPLFALVPAMNGVSLQMTF